MTYPEAWRRAWTYIFLGGVLLIFSIAIVITAIVKGFYYGCPPSQVCTAVKAPIDWAYGHIFFIPWFWSWIPDAPSGEWYLSLLSSAGLCALFFLLFALFLSSNGNQLRMLLDEARWEADKRAFGESYKPGNTQTTGPINAGGGVKIEQIINNSPEVKKWNKNFFKKPPGLIIIAVLGGVLTLYFGQVLGFSH